MPIQFSPVIAAKQRALPGFSSLLYVDIDELGVAASPVAVLDDFRVGGMPFSPHPHAGFAAVTYVFEDSPGDLRSRASSGVDLVVGPGGIVWDPRGQRRGPRRSPGRPGPGATRDPDLRQPQLAQQAHPAPGPSSRPGRRAGMAQ